jgi:hypothetical protein
MRATKKNNSKNNAKPLAPWLPAPYGKMTREQLDAESARYDAEFSATRARAVANSRPHPRRRGRPRKPAGKKAARVLITMSQPLLAAADAAAGQRGLTRAGLIRKAVLDWLGRQPRRRKSA